jgi:hypothetical protein
LFGGLLAVERLPVAVGFDLDRLIQLPVAGAVGRLARARLSEAADLLERGFADAGHAPRLAARRGPRVCDRAQVELAVSIAICISTEREGFSRAAAS